MRRAKQMVAQIISHQIYKRWVTATGTRIATEERKKPTIQFASQIIYLVYLSRTTIFFLNQTPIVLYIVPRQKNHLDILDSD